MENDKIDTRVGYMSISILENIMRKEVMTAWESKSPDYHDFMVRYSRLKQYLNNDNNPSSGIDSKVL